jgi:sugar lactone lactonase YvrE
VAGNGKGGFDGDGRLATGAQLGSTYSVTIDSTGNLYIADSSNHRIRKVAPTGIITTVAGNGEEGFNGDGDQATKARMNLPTGVAVDSVGNLYIADNNNNRVRKVSPLSR